MVSATLSSSVLVLNRNYLAVHVVSVRKAFLLLFRDIAEVVTIDDGSFSNYGLEDWLDLSQLEDAWPREDDGEWVRTVSCDIRIPRIIRLLFYDRLPSRHVKFNRRNIYARDGSRCQYCGKRFPTSELSLDHVVPRSRGGLSEWTNLVCCCTRCNVRKGGRTPVEAGMRLMRKPFRPKRSPAVTLRLMSNRYESWKHFLDTAYWNVELEP